MANNYKLVKAPSDYPGTVYSWGHRVLAHHLVWWEHTGEVVPKGYEIHHKNGNKSDNRFSNLELLTAKKHHAKHRPKTPDVVVNCAWCEKPVKVLSRNYNFKRKNQQNNFFCCSAHAALFGNYKDKVTGVPLVRVPRHGTVSEYSHHGCRCAVCREVNRTRHARWRVANRKGR